MVENAGCPSCGARVRAALSEIGAVDSLEIDEGADVASVRLVHPDPVAPADVDRILAAASGEGHAYHVQPGSWRAPA